MVMRRGRVDPFDDMPPPERAPAKGHAPPQVVDVWVKLVETMPTREALDSFTRRTWRDWDPASLERLKQAILARREELARGEK